MLVLDMWLCLYKKSGNKHKKPNFNLFHPILDEERKLTKIFIFTFFCGAPKGFINALKAYVNFCFNTTF